MGTTNWAGKSEDRIT